MRFTILIVAALFLRLQANANPGTCPNIVVFIADDWGWEESTPYGNNYIHTPNIARLANEGMRFDNFYLTASSCSPSRVSMLTGLYPHSSGAPDLHMNVPDSTELLPQLLHASGYYTMLAGKIHGINTKASRAKFDYIDEADWSKPWTMGDKWIKALNQRPKEQPFFLWAASIDPHRPFKQGLYPYNHSPDSVTVPPYYPDTKEVREELADYYDEIGRFDEHVGSVLDYLEKNNLLSNTIILVISDNGKAFPQSKTRVNMQGLRSPLIIRFPKMIAPGSVSASLVSAVDLAPTLLQLAHAKRLQYAQGKSFVNVLKKPSASIREFAFGEHNWHSYTAYERAAISKDFIYIRNWLPELPATPAGEIVPRPFYQTMQRLYYNNSLPAQFADCFIVPRPSEELFNVKNDIHCMRNLAADKKRYAILEKMRRVLDNWLLETGDKFPGREKLKKDANDRRIGKADNG